MRSLLASVRREDGFDRVEVAVRSLEEEWRHGEPVVEKYWADHDPERTTSVLAALVKADLRCRFSRGERPTINEYLLRFPQLRDEGERVLSLIYEEYCLREERGEQPDPDSFCDQYAPWRDSLASQLKYHQLLSRVVGPTAATPRFPEPGEHFLEFAIDSVLGQGGAARVYRARNDLLGGRQVALKVSPDRGQEPSIMGRLDHEHIVPVHSVVFQTETRLRGLIMPYRAGLALDEVIRRINPSSRPGSARVFWEVVAAEATADEPALDGHPRWSGFPARGTYAQGVAWLIGTLASAVAYAHARFIHHRDIKPANVLLTLHNGPQLLDFNLAYEPHAAGQAEAALRGGTLPYMAPEQLEAFIDPAQWNKVDAGADLYSLGLVMFELLTGQAPEVPDQSIPLPRAIRGLLDRRLDQRFAPRRLNPEIPHALEAITLRCLAYRDADRYPSAQALADDLQLFLKNQPLRHAENPSLAERFKNWSRRNGYVLAASLLLGSLGAYATARYLTPVERTPAFQDALAAVEHGDHQRAIGLLDVLAGDHPRSALVQLYYGAELAQVRQIDKAAVHYAKALQVPRADLVFRAWAREYPGLISEFESLGIMLVEGETMGPKGRTRGYPDLGHQALATAILLGSTKEKVIIQDALYDEERKDYKLALGKLTALIERIQAYPLPQAERNRLLNDNNCYRYCARILIQLGTERVARSSSETLREAQSYFDAAIADIEEGRRLLGSDVRRRDSYDFFLASAKLGLGLVAILQERPLVAEAHHLATKEILARLRLGHSREPSFKKLEERSADLELKIRSRPTATLSSVR